MKWYNCVRICLLFLALICVKTCTIQCKLRGLNDILVEGGDLSAEERDYLKFLRLFPQFNNLEQGGTMGIASTIENLAEIPTQAIPFGGLNNFSPGSLTDLLSVGPLSKLTERVTSGVEQATGGFLSANPIGGNKRAVGEFLPTDVLEGISTLLPTYPPQQRPQIPFEISPRNMPLPPPTYPPQKRPQIPFEIPPRYPMFTPPPSADPLTPQRRLLANNDLLEIDPLSHLLSVKNTMSDAIRSSAPIPGVDSVLSKLQRDPSEFLCNSGNVGSVADLVCVDGKFSPELMKNARPSLDFGQFEIGFDKMKNAFDSAMNKYSLNDFRSALSSVANEYGFEIGDDHFKTIENNFEQLKAKYTPKEFKNMVAEFIESRDLLSGNSLDISNDFRGQVEAFSDIYSVSEIKNALKAFGRENGVSITDLNLAKFKNKLEALKEKYTPDEIQVVFEEFAKSEKLNIRDGDIDKLKKFFNELKSKYSANDIVLKLREIGSLQNLSIPEADLLKFRDYVASFKDKYSPPEVEKILIEFLRNERNLTKNESILSNTKESLTGALNPTSLQLANVMSEYLKSGKQFLQGSDKEAITKRLMELTGVNSVDGLKKQFESMTGFASKKEINDVFNTLKEGAKSINLNDIRSVPHGTEWMKQMAKVLQLEESKLLEAYSLDELRELTHKHLFRSSPSSPDSVGTSEEADSFAIVKILQLNALESGKNLSEVVEEVCNLTDHCRKIGTDVIGKEAEEMVTLLQNATRGTEEIRVLLKNGADKLQSALPSIDGLEADNAYFLRNVGKPDIFLKDLQRLVNVPQDVANSERKVMEYMDNIIRQQTNIAGDILKSTGRARELTIDSDPKILAAQRAFLDLVMQETEKDVREFGSVLEKIATTGVVPGDVVRSVYKPLKESLKNSVMGTAATPGSDA